MADPGPDRHPRPPARGRGGKKADGTGGQAEQALGRSVGGFGTKVHGRFNGLGLPTKFLLTPGPTADITQADALLAGVDRDVAIADKAFDKQELVDAIETSGAEAVIPSRRNRTDPREIDRERYKDRNLAERGWAQLKPFRRVATRYEKTARNFLAFLHVASIALLLK